MSALAGGMWAITSYFDPLADPVRLRNFRLFKRSLQLPLVTVELGFDGRFDLSTSDSEILVQIPGSAVLWQKERLLNVALEALPRNCEFVAWLDGDTVLPETRWVERAQAALDRFALVQLFTECREVRPSQGSPEEQILVGRSAASVLQREEWAASLEAVARAGLRPLFGLAWASRKRTITKAGFYDAMILGGGDRAMACAAYGQFEHAIEFARLSACRAAHYKQWANRHSTPFRGKSGTSKGRYYTAGMVLPSRGDTQIAIRLWRQSISIQPVTFAWTLTARGLGGPTTSRFTA